MYYSDRSTFIAIKYRFFYCILGRSEILIKIFFFLKKFKKKSGEKTKIIMNLFVVNDKFLVKKLEKLKQ